MALSGIGLEKFSNSSPSCGISAVSRHLGVMYSIRRRRHLYTWDVTGLDSRSASSTNRRFLSATSSLS